ncbi:hypothetical protein K438DRAFT_1932923 [Mycena galopus ATCC 62051]|nr:hypothetical protein K438DRAFT_1932923 [Mycena galopus ATCC 62051]
MRRLEPSGVLSGSKIEELGAQRGLERGGMGLEAHGSAVQAGPKLEDSSARQNVSVGGIGRLEHNAPLTSTRDSSNQSEVQGEGEKGRNKKGDLDGRWWESRGVHQTRKSPWFHPGGPTGFQEVSPKSEEEGVAKIQMLSQRTQKTGGEDRIEVADTIFCEPEVWGSKRWRRDATHLLTVVALVT